MGAVLEERARSDWWSDIWEEHRSWIVTFALLAVSLVIWKIHGGETIFPKSWNARSGGVTVGYIAVSGAASRPVRIR